MRICVLLTTLCSIFAGAAGVMAAEESKETPAAAAAAADPDDGRILTSLKSANELLADVEYIVSDLAGEKSAWDQTIKANIEIWLFGVDPALPVGADVIFDPDAGRRMQLNIPIEDARDFRESNLNPIDITTRPVAGSKNQLFELGGLRTGFLRYVETKGQPTYAVISKLKSEVPPDMKSPQAKLEKVLGDYDAAILWHAEAATKAQRAKGFDKLRENVLEAVKKRPDETAAAYELRRTAVEQQSMRLARLLTNTAELKAGWKTDGATKQFGGDSRIVGLPETPLAEDIAKIGSETSRFAKAPVSEKAVLKARILMPFNDQYRKEQAEVYQKWLAAWDEKISAKEGTADEKAARKELAERVVALLTESLDLGWIDGYGQVTPDDGGLYTGVMGLRLKDSSDVPSILEILPRIQPGWHVQLNASEVQGVKIHKLDLREKLPKSLQEFFGDSGLILIGTGEQTLWVAGGAQAEAELSAAITAAAGDGEAAAADPIQLTMRLQPILKFMHAFLQDRDIELVRSLNQSPLLKGGDPEAQKKSKEAGDKKVTREALKNFKWQETAIAALENSDDALEIHVHKDADALLGKLTVGEGVMRAIGKVSAKFANEMLK